ncbi:MAG: acylphosphatase [Chthoniobacterales bacterium]
MMIAKQIFYSGHVQGVGFRYSVKQIAKGFSVIGSVQNLADGRVELQIGGEAEEVAAFLAAIEQSELRPHIRETVEQPLSAPPDVRGFEICHG